MNSTETTPPLVHIRSDNRRGAVAEALALLEPDLSAALERAGGQARIVPGASGTPEVVAAVVDAVLALGAKVAVQTDTRLRAGLEAELWGRPVELLDSPGREGLAIFLADARGRGAHQARQGDLVIAEGRPGWSRRRVVAVAGFDPTAIGAALAGRPPAGARWLGDPIAGRPSAAPAPHFGRESARADRVA